MRGARAGPSGCARFQIACAAGLPFLCGGAGRRQAGCLARSKMASRHHNKLPGGPVMTSVCCSITAARSPCRRMGSVALGTVGIVQGHSARASRGLLQAVKWPPGVAHTRSLLLMVRNRLVSQRSHPPPSHVPPPTCIKGEAHIYYMCSMSSSWAVGAICLGLDGATRTGWQVVWLPNLASS